MDYAKLRECELFLFDMDGTLYLGDEVYEGAIELMEDLPALGKKYIYLTNNSSRAGTDYITRLKGFGFPCEAENVFTSGMATGLYLNEKAPGARVYLVGTQAFRRELQTEARIRQLRRRAPTPSPRRAGYSAQLPAKRRAPHPTQATSRD